MSTTNPAPDQPRHIVPDGRTALVSMFPMHMDQPINGVQPPTPSQTENRPQAQTNSMNAGK
jgi:hypothetical protein